MKSVAILLSILAIATAAVTIHNGGFEINNCSSTSFCEYGTGNSIPSWSIDSGNVDLVFKNNALGLFFPHSGSWSLDLNGNTPGGISQTIATQPGHHYRVSFWFAGNPNCGSAQNIKTMLVHATGGNTNTYTFNTNGNTIKNPGWIQESYSFVASSSSTHLSFTSTNTGFCGPTLDDVSIADISSPEVFCSDWSWKGELGYFCSEDRQGFFMCLKGEFADQDAFMDCAKGSTCGCKVGVECSSNGSPCSIKNKAL